MKRNRLFILGIVTVLVALLSLTLVSGTFAKYTSSATATDSARVAKWSIKVGSTEIANETPQAITFDLFNTVKDSNGTANETDVKVGEGETIIAPGTSGSFDLSLQNLSEVTAEIALTVVETNGSDIPLVFTVDGAGSYETIQAALDAAFGLNASHKAVFAMEQASATTKTIGWKWLFETDPLTDTADTALGIAAQTTPPTYSVQLTVIATQVD